MNYKNTVRAKDSLDNSKESSLAIPTNSMSSNNITLEPIV